MSEELLIRHCSSTLAGLKTGSLFNCPCHSLDEMRGEIRRMNKRLRKKGLRVVPLRFTKQNALIYVYRPSKLKKDLADETAEFLLQHNGYACDGAEKCVACLSRRMKSNADFPHEIGLFLGYPPEDVKGFMEQGSQKCKCSGCWKVYGDAEHAKKLFAQYKKCTDVYARKYSDGRSIEQLAVAA